jgi:hypothetical protein
MHMRCACVCVYNSDSVCERTSDVAFSARPFRLSDPFAKSMRGNFDIASED